MGVNLTEAEIAELRAFAATASKGAIARRYRVCFSTVGRWVEKYGLVTLVGYEARRYGIRNSNRIAEEHARRRAKSIEYRNITADQARDLFIYYPETGEIFHRHDRVGVVAGTRAYCATPREWWVQAYGTRHLAHRLIWLMTYGRWPECYIDHINGNPLDNRLCNLREADTFQNVWNSRAPCHNTSGVKGVSFDKKSGKWHARIMICGHRHHLGFFENKDDAIAAYRRASAKMHGEFARAA